MFDETKPSFQRLLREFEALTLCRVIISVGNRWSVQLGTQDVKSEFSQLFGFLNILVYSVLVSGLNYKTLLPGSKLVISYEGDYQYSGPQI